jgi:hypothetical protein
MPTGHLNVKYKHRVYQMYCRQRALGLFNIILVLCKCDASRSPCTCLNTNPSWSPPYVSSFQWHWLGVRCSYKQDAFIFIAKLCCLYKRVNELSFPFGTRFPHSQWEQGHIISRITVLWLVHGPYTNINQTCHEDRAVLSGYLRFFQHFLYLKPKINIVQFI